MYFLSISLFCFFNISCYSNQAISKDDNLDIKQIFSLGSEDEIIYELKNLLRLGKNLEESSRKYSALTLACEKNFLNVCSFLSERMNVHWMNDEEKSALMVAIEKSNKGIVEVLLKKERLVNERVLELAVESRRREILEILLLKAKVDETNILAFASKKGFVDMVEILINKANMNKRLTALHHAILNNQMEVVRFFVKHDVDLIHYSEDRGRTALMLALYSKNVEISKFLLEAGALDIEDIDGNSAFALARELGILKEDKAQ